MHDAEPPLRAGSRSLAWLAGPLATGLGWAAHMLGGGRSPALLIVVALAALLGMAAAMAGPRRLPPWAVLVVAGLAQQLLHLAFSALSSPSGFALPGHGHGDVPSPQAAEEPGRAAPHDLHLLLYLHATAALLTALAVTQWEKIKRWRRQESPAGDETAVRK